MDYGEMIASMDSTVGKLVATLDRLGIRKETVVIFTTTVLRPVPN